MQAPRLRVGIFDDGSSTVNMAEKLDSVGHYVTVLHAPEDIRDFELVVIDALGVEGYVEKLSAFARRGQMFLHTSLTHGITVMDPLETSGGIVMSAHPIGQDRWVASALDELGETIVGLLVGELGGSVIDIADDKRALLAAALTYAGFLSTLQRDASYFLDEFLGDPVVTSDIVMDSAQQFQALPSLDEVIAQYDSINNPSRQRLFRDLARRQAEISRAQDIELWAIQKEDR